MRRKIDYDKRRGRHSFIQVDALMEREEFERIESDLTFLEWLIVSYPLGKLRTLTLD